MKKIWMAIVLAAAVMAAGCSANNEKENSTAANNEVQEVQNEEGTTEVETEIEEEVEEVVVEEVEEDGVTVIFPASINIDGDVEGMTTEIKEAGATDIVTNEDGSVSVTISQDDLDQLLEKYRAEMEEAISGLQSEEYTGSIKDLQYDEETYSTFELTVDRAAYESEESMDGLVLFGLMMQSVMYQIYSGVEEADMRVTITLVDESTGEVFDETILPQ